MALDYPNMSWPYQAELWSAKFGAAFVVTMKYCNYLFEIALEMSATIFVIIKVPWKCWGSSKCSEEVYWLSGLFIWLMMGSRRDLDRVRWLLQSRRPGTTYRPIRLYTGKLEHSVVAVKGRVWCCEKDRFNYRNYFFCRELKWRMIRLLFECRALQRTAYHWNMLVHCVGHCYIGVCGKYQ